MTPMAIPVVMVPSWWKHPAVVALKRNPVTVTLFNAWLDFRCRNLECYIFVATTGRSGTTSLARVFETVLDGAIRLHEPPPVMFSDYPRGQGIDRDDYFRRLFIPRNAHISSGPLRDIGIIWRPTISSSRTSPVRPSNISETKSGSFI